MSILIGFLTVVLVLDCLLIILLVLIQLPKKEAGMGTAFGGGATDALFGAGTGTALTKMTKYSAAIFFVIALALTVLNNARARQNGSLFQKAIQQEANKAPEPAPAVTAAPAATASASVTFDTNALKKLATNAPNATNTAASAATNKTEANGAPPAKTSPPAQAPAPK